MAETGGGFTLASALFGEEDAGTALREALGEDGPTRTIAAALKGLSAPLRSAAGDEVVRVIAGVLELDLTDVLVAGWRKHAALTDAAGRTLASPGAEEIVELAAHRIASTHQPRVDVLVDGAKVAKIDLEINLTIDLHMVCGVVAAGRLIALRSGQADLQVALSCEGVPVASAARRVDVPITVGLGSGILLVEPTEPGHGGSELP